MVEFFYFFRVSYIPVFIFFSHLGFILHGWFCSGNRYLALGWRLGLVTPGHW